jgi:hypothetical protein
MVPGGPCSWNPDQQRVPGSNFTALFSVNKQIFKKFAGIEGKSVLLYC